MSALPSASPSPSRSSHAPTPPPKPLHLTLSLRSKEAAAYPRMPRWSQHSSHASSTDSICEGPEGPDSEEEEGGGSTLHAVRRDWNASSGGSTLRPAKQPPAAGTRLSILFDPGLGNPLEVGAEHKRTLSRRRPSPLTPSPPESSSLQEALEEDSDEEQTMLDLSEEPRMAVATHNFSGEAAFGELSFSKGAELVIECDDLGSEGGWALGWVRESGEVSRGLVPRGWYKYVDQEKETPPAPPATEPVPEPSSPSSRAQVAELFFGRKSESSPPSSPATSVGGSDSPPDLEHTLSPTAPPSPEEDPNGWTSQATSLPQTPYSVRSIGRNVVVSGVEFEPTDFTPATSASVEPHPSEVEEGELSFKRAVRERSSTSFEVSPQKHWSRQPAPRIETAFSSPSPKPSSPTWLTEEPSAAGVRVPTPTSGHFAWSDSVQLVPATPAQSTPPSPSAREETRDGEQDLVPPLGLNPNSRLSLTDSRASLGFRDADIPRRPPSEESEASQAPSTEGTFIGRIGLGTLRTGYGLFGISAAAESLAGIRPRDEVERWILHGSHLDQLAPLRRELGRGGAGAQVWHVEAGPEWQGAEEGTAFTVHVHSPEVSNVCNGGTHMVYHLTTVFPPSGAGEDDEEVEADEDALGAVAHCATVTRRFSHFVQLHAVLVSRYPLLGIPELPPKSVINRTDAAFVEGRRRDLERWLARVARHPVLRESNELRAFLVVESEKELALELKVDQSSNKGDFFERVLHPDFNVDPDDASDLANRFERHAKALQLGLGPRAIEDALSAMRSSMSGLGGKTQYLGQALVKLVAGKALPPLALDAAYEIHARQRASGWCISNRAGSFSFHLEEDSYGLSLAKAVQAAGEALDGVGELYESLARGALLPPQELLRENEHPLAQHAGLIHTHRQVLQLQETLSALPACEESAEALARVDTVLNVTSAEIERAHREGQQDLRTATEHLLDAQIELHRGALEKLESAREHFDPGAFEALAQTGPRLHSTLERAGEAQVLPLPLPSTFGVPRSVTGWTDGVGSLFRRASTAAPSGTVANGAGRGVGRSNSARAYASTAGTVGSMSVAEIVAARTRAGGGDWRSSYF